MVDDDFDDPAFDDNFDDSVFDNDDHPPDVDVPEVANVTNMASTDDDNVDEDDDDDNNQDALSV